MVWCMNAKGYGIVRGRRTPAEVRRELVLEFRRVGGTQAAFCRQRGLNAQTFCRWLRECSEEQVEDEAVFHEVQVSSCAAKGIAEVEIALRNGVVLRVRGSVDVVELAMRLGGCGC